MFRYFQYCLVKIQHFHMKLCVWLCIFLCMYFHVYVYDFLMICMLFFRYIGSVCHVFKHFNPLHMFKWKTGSEIPTTRELEIKNVKIPTTSVARHITMYFIIFFRNFICFCWSFWNFMFSWVSEWKCSIAHLCLDIFSNLCDNFRRNYLKIS